MLDGLLETIQKLQDFSFDEVAQEIISTKSEDILEIIRNQLELGIDGTGSPLYLISEKTGKKSYNYSNFTISIKEQYGEGLSAVTDHITLYSTGEFYESIYLIVKENGYFDILSKDPKYPFIERMSGKHLLEISPQGAEVLGEQSFTPIFQERLNQALS